MKLLCYIYVSVRKKYISGVSGPDIILDKFKAKILKKQLLLYLKEALTSFLCFSSFTAAADLGTINCSVRYLWKDFLVNKIFPKHKISFDVFLRYPENFWLIWAFLVSFLHSNFSLDLLLQETCVSGTSMIGPRTFRPCAIWPRTVHPDLFTYL